MSRTREQPPRLHVARRDLVLAVTRSGAPRLSQTSASRAGRCVLISHRVVAGTVERDHDMTWSSFLAHVDALIAAGCVFSRDLGGDPRDGAVVLTFDDATSDHRHVAEGLTQRGIGAIFFVPADVLGTPGFLENRDLSKMVAGGHTIGSHGWSHVRLDRVAQGDLAREIESSRHHLEDVAGAPVTLFAPAGGIGVPSLASRLHAAGYTASRSTRWGIHRQIADRWHIPAVPVTRVTADRGWVHVAAVERRLPVAMIAAGAVRGALGSDTRTKMRGRLHRSADAAKRVSAAIVGAIPSLGDPPV